MHITVTAPPEGRMAGPVAARVPMERIDDSRMLGLVEESTGEPLPVQVDSRGRLCWWQPALAPNQQRVYRQDTAGFLAGSRRVVVREHPEGGAEIYEDGKRVARFTQPPDADRPMLADVLSPSGHAVLASSAPSQQQHSLQPAGCFSGWPDVNGVDHWRTAADCGRQRLVRFSLCVSGPVFGRISAVIEWLDAAGTRQFTEQRVFTFYRGASDVRIIDLTHRIMCTDGDIHLGDVADGGWCAARLAGPLTPAGGGFVRNADEASGQPECHGASAMWCDATGQIDDRFVGLAIVDCPNNRNAPARWNVTENGLLSPNPFGSAAFNEHAAGAASVLRAGSVTMFRYRMLIHECSPTEQQLAGLCDCFYRSLDVQVTV